LFRSRSSLHAEVLTLRQQLNVLRRKAPARPDPDRQIANEYVKRLQDGKHHTESCHDCHSMHESGVGWIFRKEQLARRSVRQTARRPLLLDMARAHCELHGRSAHKKNDQFQGDHVTD
jgi:hypothetical protein